MELCVGEFEQGGVPVMLALNLRVVRECVDDNTESLARAVSCWNSGDLAGYLKLYHDEVRVFGYGAGPMDKRMAAAFYETLWSALGAAGRPGPVLTIEEGAADGDLFACRTTLSGVHRGPFLDLPPTQRAYVLPGITMMRFMNGRVIEQRSCEDMLGLLVHLGGLDDAAQINVRFSRTAYSKGPFACFQAASPPSM